MKSIAIAGFSFVLAAVCGMLRAQDAPTIPGPGKEHAWLEQFVGQWESEVEIVTAPGEASFKFKGAESGRTLGGFWAVIEGKSDIMGMKLDSVLTLGYDPEKKKYIGTWVDSTNSYLWKYEGTLDTAGKIMTFESEGPCPLAGGKICKFKEVMEFKSKDHRVSTGSVLGDDGKWTTFQTINARRKK